jgi:hypothetical protein
MPTPMGGTLRAPPIAPIGQPLLGGDAVQPIEIDATTARMTSSEGPAPRTNDLTRFGTECLRPAPDGPLEPRAAPDPNQMW